ncbi:MAG: hypothetical protein IPL75_00420 [Acidobacteria bacterium]|nr:hypothetical protein [Acidobacteriota bacterium]
MTRKVRGPLKMSADQWQLWIAIYGAVMASLAVGWQVWTTVKDKPLLQASAVAPNALMRHEIRLPNPDSSRFTLVYPIAISNAGLRTMTVVSGRLSLNLTTKNSGMGFEGAERENFPLGTFPLKLEAGEAKHVFLPLLFEAAPGSLLKAEDDGLIHGDLVLTLETTEGRILRTVEFRVSQFQLNDVRTRHIYH